MTLLCRATCFHICVHQGGGDYYHHQVKVNFMLSDPPLNQPLGSRKCQALIGLRSGLPETITMEGDNSFNCFIPEL